jgi:pimeloyl-ACP methyl ester carboxylesterase
MDQPVALIKSGAKIIAMAFLIVLGMAAAQFVSNTNGRPSLGTTHVAKENGKTLTYNILLAETETRLPLFLIPSLGRPASDFNELAAELVRDGHNVYFIDPRNFYLESGQTTKNITLFDLADDVETIRRDAGLDSIILVGHAFGNRVARAYATSYPETTGAVITIAAGGVQTISDDIRVALTRSFWGFLPDSWRQTYIRKAFFADDNEIPAHWLKGWHIRVSQIQIEATQNTDTDLWWSGGQAPILVIQGREDTIAPPEKTGDLLRAQYPQRVSAVTLTPAGHALLPEQPAAIRTAISQFLAIHGQDLASSSPPLSPKEDVYGTE